MKRLTSFSKAILLKFLPKYFAVTVFPTPPLPNIKQLIDGGSFSSKILL